MDLALIPTHLRLRDQRDDYLALGPQSSNPRSYHTRTGTRWARCSITWRRSRPRRRVQRRGPDPWHTVDRRPAHRSSPPGWSRRSRNVRLRAGRRYAV